MCKVLLTFVIDETYRYGIFSQRDVMFSLIYYHRNMFFFQVGTVKKYKNIIKENIIYIMTEKNPSRQTPRKSWPFAMEFSKLLCFVYLIILFCLPVSSNISKWFVAIFVKNSIILSARLSNILIIISWMN